MGQRKLQIGLLLSAFGFSVGIQDGGITILLGFINIRYCPKGKGIDFFINWLGDNIYRMNKTKLG